jgi:hypothetical protein
MATYVNDLRLKEIATGDESGTWGTSTNTNLELIGESMGHGTEAVADASTHTITMADGATDGFRCTFLRLTGGGQACTVTLAPNTVSHTWIIRNATSYALTFTQGSGANVIIAAGQVKIVSTDGAGSGAIVYECLEDLELGGTLTVGIDDTGQDVKFFGATSGKYWLWDESADGVVQQGTLTVGVNDTGFDVKFFGATSGAYMLWDESADDLKLVGAAGFTVAGDIDVDGTANLDIVDIDGAVDMASTLAVAGVLTGASLDISGDIDVDGTSNLDVVDIDGAVDMATTALVTGVLTTTATQVATGGITSGSNILSDTDSTDSLGSTGVRWLKGWFDTLTAGTLTIGSGSVTDSSGAISFGNENLTTTGIVTAAGTSVFTNLDISGDVDVDGTSNLDIVDIDGAVDMASTLAVTGVTTLSTHLVMGDSDIIKLGASADLQIYHDGTHSYVSDTGTGDLRLTGANIGLRGATAGDNFIYCTEDGGVTLYYDDAGKLATVTDGVTITGALTKSSGSFTIDHPIGSKNSTHNLVHSFIEGPQADLIYRGTVALSGGSATVNIDTAAGMTAGTFVLLCGDVQCFTTNEDNWDLVKGSVSGNVLTITSQNSSSTATISWLVIGERKDQHMIDTSWTDSQGKVIVEPEKT